MIPGVVSGTRVSLAARLNRGVVRYLNRGVVRYVNRGVVKCLVTCLFEVWLIA